MRVKTPTVNQLLRIGVSLLFIFSGCIKLNDPVGFSLTIEAYLRGFAVDVNTLFLAFLPYSLFIAYSACISEVVLGMALLLRFHTRFTLRSLGGLMIFFTCLALYTIWFRRLDSCGCLSDAIPLTPRQSFIKNILLLLALHLLYRQPATYTKSRFPFIVQLMLLLLVGVGSMGMGLYTFYKLPLLEVGPYKIHTHIPDLLYPIRFLYDPVGEEENKEAYENPAYPLDTMKRVLSPRSINQAIQPKVTHFAIWDEKKEITTELLQGVQLIGIIQNPTQLTAKTQLKLDTFVKHLSPSIKFLWLFPLHVDQALLPTSLTPPWAWGSPDLLRALLRADIGLVLLQEGTLQGKWSYRDLSKAQQYLAQQGWYQASGKPCATCNKHKPPLDK